MLAHLLNLVAAAFSSAQNTPSVLAYQGVVAMKYILAVESLEPHLKHRLIELIVPQIDTSNYEKFFDIIYGMMK